VKIKHVLLDFDGVIRHWPSDNAQIEAKYGLPKDSLLRTAFSKQLLNPAILGKISDAVWRESIAQSLSHHYPSSSAEQAVLEWSTGIGAIDSSTLAWLHSFEGVELSLVTNATSRLDTDLVAHNIVNVFDHIFNSSDIGLIKPDPQYYSYVLDSLASWVARLSSVC